MPQPQANKRDEHGVVRGRSWIAALLIAVMTAAIIVQLSSLQLRNGEAYALESQNKKTRTITLQGSRGKILDSNGNALAFDEKSYDVTFYRDPSHTKTADRHAYTKAIAAVIDIVERNGLSTISGFALKPNPMGGWMFDFGTTDPTIFAKRESMWRTNMSLSDMPIDELYDTLCARYGIDPATPYDKAAKILAVWQESRNIAFLSLPAVVAKSVSFGVVAEIMARSPDLQGFDVVDSYTRRYPMGSLAAHIIGYESRIPDSRAEEFKLKGYASDDMVGVAGIEASMEEHLTGNIDYRQGSQTIEVNSQGKQISEISYAPPQSGNSVKLTIDSKLQSVVETSLKNAIEGPIREGQIARLAELEADSPKRYEEIMTMLASAERDIKLAETGAAIVMDVHTGRVLAMASYPDYDLSIFSGGVDTAGYNALLEDSRLPLFHRAISGRYPPGSIFKMATGLGALMEGVVTPTQTIDDGGAYTKYTTLKEFAPSCWVRPSFHKHSGQDIKQAILNSCNYYFYTVADDMGINNLYKWAGNLGLTTKTGIELPSESTSIVSSPDMLWDPTRPTNRQGTSKPIQVQNRINEIIRNAGSSIGIEYDDERVEASSRKMLELIHPDVSMSNEVAPQVRDILLNDLSLPANVISGRGMVSAIDNYLLEIRWSGNETILTGIGQSNTILTPIAVARYISAIANGGTVYEAQIVDSIIAPDGTLVTKKQPVVSTSLVNDPMAAEMLSLIHQGMKGVISEEDHGTASGYFADFQYRDMVGAKTGTAQVAGKIEIENDGWFVSYLPYDNPEIAVVIVVENSYSGGLASTASKDIMNYYIEQKNQPERHALPEDWAWTE